MISINALNIENKSLREITTYLIGNRTELILDFRVNQDRSCYFEEYNKEKDNYNEVNFYTFHESIILGKHFINDPRCYYDGNREQVSDSESDKRFNEYVGYERQFYDGCEWKMYENAIGILYSNLIVDNYYELELSVIESLSSILKYISYREGDFYCVSQVIYIYTSLAKDLADLKHIYRSTVRHGVKIDSNIKEIIKISNQIGNLDISQLFRKCWHIYYGSSKEDECVPNSLEAIKLIKEYVNKDDDNIINSISERLEYLKDLHENIDHYELVEIMRKPALKKFLYDLVDKNFHENYFIDSFLRERREYKLNNVTILISDKDKECFEEIRSFIINNYSRSRTFHRFEFSQCY